MSDATHEGGAVGYRELLTVAVPLLLAGYAVYAGVLMLHAWARRPPPELGHSSQPTEPTQRSFSVLLLVTDYAGCESAAIRKIAGLAYPRELVEVLAVVPARDTHTCARVTEQIAEIRRVGIDRLRVIAFDEPPFTPTNALNIGLRWATNDVVAIFDTADEPHPDILRMVDTAMNRADIAVVESAVRPLEDGCRWPSIIYTIDRLPSFQRRSDRRYPEGFASLADSAVFVRRDALQHMDGWTPTCVSPGADLGTRLSVAGIPVHTLSDAVYATGRHAPATVQGFVNHQARRYQGHLQVLVGGSWLRLPTWPGRLLAFFTLAVPYARPLIALYVVATAWLVIAAAPASLIALLVTLPVGAVLFQLASYAMSVRNLAAAKGWHSFSRAYLQLATAYLPHQGLLCWAALLAVWRQIHDFQTREPVRHTRNTHPTASTIPPPRTHWLGCGIAAAGIAAVILLGATAARQRMTTSVPEATGQIFIEPNVAADVPVVPRPPVQQAVDRLSTSPQPIRTPQPASTPPPTNSPQSTTTPQTTGTPQQVRAPQPTIAGLAASRASLVSGGGREIPLPRTVLTPNTETTGGGVNQQ